jgi:hypothetical protein
VALPVGPIRSSIWGSLGRLGLALKDHQAQLPTEGQETVRDARADGFPGTAHETYRMVYGAHGHEVVGYVGLFFKASCLFVVSLGLS